MITQIKDTFMKKRVIIIIALSIIIVSGATTYAVISLIKSKNNSSEQSGTSANRSPKQRADAAEAEAKKLVEETAKMGSGKEADKKTQEAAAKFNEASKLYKQAGDSAASYEAQANADSLTSRLAAEESYKTQLEAEHAKQKADLEAAKAAMQAGGQ